MSYTSYTNLPNGQLEGALLLYKLQITTSGVSDVPQHNEIVQQCCYISKDHEHRCDGKQGSSGSTFEKCAAALSRTNLRLRAAVSRMMRPSASAFVRPAMKPTRACRAEI